MENLIQIVFTVLLWTLLSVVAIWLPAWWLWNHLISTKLGLPSLTFIESTGLVVYFWLVTKGAAKFKIELGGQS